MKFLNFCGSFLPSWIRIPNTDPDPLIWLNPDPKPCFSPCCRFACVKIVSDGFSTEPWPALAWRLAALRTARPFPPTPPGRRAVVAVAGSRMATATTVVDNRRQQPSSTTLSLLWLLYICTIHSQPCHLVVHCKPICLMMILFQIL